MNRVCVTVISSLVFMSCGIIGGSPQKTASNFVKAAQSGSVRDMFDQLDKNNFGCVNDLESERCFANEYNGVANRSHIAWTGDDLPIAFYKVFFAACTQFKVSSCGQKSSTATIIMKLEYSKSNGPVFANGFIYMDEEPSYSGIRPIYIDSYGSGPLGPYSPDDPVLTNGFNWHRRLLKLKVAPIKSMAIEMRLTKDKDGWVISKILQPYAESEGNQGIVNEQYMANFVLSETSGLDESENAEKSSTPSLAGKEHLSSVRGSNITSKEEDAATNQSDPRKEAIRIHERESKNAGEAQEAIGAIWAALKVQHAQTGSWATSVSQLTRLNLDPGAKDKWSFTITPSSTGIGSITAISTGKMPDGAGKSVKFDAQIGKWSGYGTD